MKLRITHQELMEALETTDVPDNVKVLVQAAQAELATPGEWASAAATNVVDTGGNNQ